jgi:segregation and condensation protein B
MSIAKIQASIESILFIAGEPVTEKKLKNVLAIEQDTLKEALTALDKRYREDQASGLNLVFHKDQILLTTKPDQASFIEQLTKETLQESLTKTQLEVLAIIAYRGPISRPEIEAIRGVNCSFTLRNLLLRELIEREDNPDNLRGYVYMLSPQFLMTLGMSSLNELPDYVSLRNNERLRQAVSTEGVSQEPLLESAPSSDLDSSL